MQSTSLPPPPERARRILVVDDDEDRRVMLSRLLSKEGYEVDTLEDGWALVEQVNTRPPDLLLLDVALPGLSGFELCADLKMMEEMKLTPIILMTSQAVDEESVVRGLMCGADDYVTTPTRLAELRARIRVQLRNRRERELLEWARAQRASLKSAALVDPLTGLANRRQIDQVIDEILAGEEPIVIIMGDLDHFKSVNDTYGHATGDRVLKEVSRALTSRARTGDVVGRYGGEEFIVIVRGAKAEVAEMIAERYLQAVRGIVFQSKSGPEKVTMSLGVATCDRVTQRFARDQLLRAADTALYEAKRTGRNRLVLADDEDYPTEERRERISLR